LQNINNDAESEFLRFALADEIANALTHAHSLEIRPSASAQKYSNGESDPTKAGRELAAGTVVAGHFLKQNNTLMVTLEAVDVKSDKLIWSGSLTSTSDNLIALQNQIAKKVRQELLPALGVVNGAVETASAPANRAAYDLYLRSFAIPHDVGPNKDAITMLERAVALDSNYAPAWEVLGRRYYFDAIYSGGGVAGYERSSGAYQKALALEPGRVSAAGFLAANEVEEGELDLAYRDASALVQKRPDNAFAHYSLAYVLRYAGLLDQAQKECDKALAIDSHNFNWRSCSFAFFEAGKEERALHYLDVDSGSEWSNAVRVSVLMRQKKLRDAQQAAQQMTDNPVWLRSILQACLNHAPAADIHRLAESARNEFLKEQDPELKYYQGAILADCGEKQIAYTLLKRAVEENYCARQALQSDPLLAEVQEDADFRAITQAAEECQKKFVASRGAVGVK
jgi:TolB-like protein/lipoprotein NlpI